MAGEARPDLGPSRALPLEPIGGFGHERVDFLALTTAESQKLPHERYTSAALALRFSWPAPPAGGGDPWFGVAVSGLRRTETLLVHAADAGGRDRTLAFRIWHPRPTETLERSAAGWFLVRLPGDLLPAPGTSMQLEARPLLNDSAIRIRILEAALWWPGGSGQSSR